MATDDQSTPYNAPVLEFKSSSFSVPTLILSGNDIEVLAKQLEEKVRLAPEFFKNSPVIIELKEINRQDIDIDVATLVELTRKHGLLPIGIRGGNPQQNKIAHELCLPVYSNNARNTEVTERQKITPATSINEKSAGQPPTKLITHPVRSGQRVYTQGDLVVLAQVSAGAEIIAEGNIHVYGTLRGRALAGVQGNMEARIFCSILQAELVSIAGNYKISEDLDKTVYNKPVHIYLSNHTLVIKEL